MSASRKTAAIRAAEAHKAVTLRAQGLSVEEVAEDLGVSVQVAKTRLESAYETLPALSTEGLQNEVEVALRTVLREVGVILFDPTTPPHLKLKAAAESRAILKSLREMLGLDEPASITEELLRAELGLEGL